MSWTNVVPEIALELPQELIMLRASKELLMTTSVNNVKLRSFGLLVGGIFLILGIWPLVFRAEGVRLWAVVLGIGLLVPAVIMPGILKWPYHFWMKIGHILGWVNSRVIMTVLFYAVFTPCGFIRRLSADPMKRKFEPSSTTYRMMRGARSPSHMRHQF